LKHEYTAPGVVVTGYGADGTYDVPAGGSIVIGRSVRSEISIAAPIGGHRTYRLHWSEPHWTLTLSNEWAIARINGEQVPLYVHAKCVLRDGDVIELFTTENALAHRFRVALTS
jgi:hypothetical protein